MSMKNLARRLKLVVYVEGDQLVRRADGHKVGKADANHVRMAKDLVRLAERLLALEGEEAFTDGDTVRLRDSGLKAKVMKAEADMVLSLQLLESLEDNEKLVKGAMLTMRGAEVEKV